MIWRVLVSMEGSTVWVEVLETRPRRRGRRRQRLHRAVATHWHRIKVTIPETIGTFDQTGFDPNPSDSGRKT